MQAYNGFLQNLPPILFVLFGPLSDAYGRKPLMIMSLGGYFILNSIFLVNSIFFMELKVLEICHNRPSVARLNTCCLSVSKT